jgi:hypothetical protein
MILLRRNPRGIGTILLVCILATAARSANSQAQGQVPSKRLTAPSYFYADGVRDSPIKGRLSARIEGGGVLSCAITRKAAHGVALIADATKDEWVYTPQKGFVGNDEFQVSTTVGAETRATRVVVLVNYPASNRTLYVDSSAGNDKNPGTEASPFASIQAASNVTMPGDTVLIKNGTYRQTSGEGVLVINRSGAPGAMITYKPYPGDHPKLFAETAWNHILITGSYIRIEGLEIAGNMKSVSIADAEKVYDRFASGSGPKTFGPETSFAETNGISIRPSDTKAPVPERIFPRHIEVVDNNIHDVQGGGISAQWSDYVTFEGNRIEDVAGRAMYACSGISILGSQNTDAGGTAYRMLVENNRIVNARTYVKWLAVKHMSDGNGIILDSNRNELEKGEPFSGRYLIANNVVMDSGGAGIQVYASDNADIVYNTVYNNSLTPGLEYGQIWAHAASNLRVENNILVAGADAKINQAFTNNRDVVYDYNIYFGGRKPEIVGPHDILADPQFVDLDAGNLHLKPGSPAIDSGLSGFSVTKDFDGNPRPIGAAVDRGAFELQSAKTTH